MSRSCAWVRIVAAVSCLAPVPVVAQAGSGADQERALLHEIDSLLPLSRAASAATDRIEQRRRDVLMQAVTTTTDTAYMASVRIVTVPEQVELALELYQEVMNERLPGLESHDAFKEAWFTFQWKSQLEPIPFIGPVHRVESYRNVSREDVKRLIGHMLELVLTRYVLETESGLSSWGLTGSFEAPRAQREWQYRELATMPARAARSCLEGDLPACWTLLGLEMGPNPTREWYTPEERRAAVTRRKRWLGRAEGDLLTRCTEQGVIEACDELIESHPRPFLWEPTSERARTFMLAVALDAGGRDAWARLLEARSLAPGEALRSVSGLSKEELSARWRDSIMAARPNVYAGFGMTQIATAFWFLLFAALAMRSTRWRLG